MLEDTSEVTAVTSLHQKDAGGRVQDDPSFEDVLEELDSSGRFQVTQYALLCSSAALGVALVLSYVFIGYAPPHVCNAVNESELLTALQLQNNATVFVTYQSCELTVSTNITGKPEMLTAMSCPSGRNFSASRHTSVVTEWDMVCESTGIPELVATLFTAGTVVGGLVASPISDRFGRRIVCVACNIAVCAFEFATIFAPSIWVLIALRFCSGVFHEGHLVAVIVLAKEMWTPSGRTTSGIFDCFLWTGCTLLVGAVAYVTQDYGWRAFQIGTVLLGICFPLPLFFLKESPRWLTSRGRHKEALDILRVASKQNNKDFNVIQAKYLECASKKERKNAVRYANNSEDLKYVASNHCSKLFCNRQIIVTLTIASFAWLTHGFIYHGMFMMSSNLSGDRILNYILMCLTEIPCVFLLIVMMPRMGRRRIIAIFLSIASVSWLAYSLMTSFADNTSRNGILNVVFFLIGKFAITSSFNVLYIYTPEMFPTNIRTVCIATCKIVGRVGSFIAPYIRPFYAVILWGPAVTFCAMSVVTLLLTPMLPEMRGVNLRDTIHDERSDPKIKRRC